MESKSLIRAKSQVKSQLKTALLSNCPHHLIATHNKSQSKYNLNDECSSKLTVEMFQQFPYSSDLPKPLLPPSKIQRDCCAKEDLSMQLVHTKAKIQDDINRYLELYKKHINTFNKFEKKNVDWKIENGNTSATMPRYLAETAEILECDPDPEFSGSYNWYYTGGTLNGILYNTRNILIFPFAQELIALPIEFREDSWFMPDYKNATKLPITANPYQVVCSVLNNSARVLTRLKNNCFIHNIFNLNKEKLQLLEINNQFSDIPYVSADLDPSNYEHFCTTSTDRSISIWNLTKTKCILTGKVPTTRFLEDNWAFIKYDEYDDNILKYTDRHCVHYYDVRLPIDRPSLTMCPKDNLEECENLSMYCASSKSEYFSYVGSNHSICLLDQRSAHEPVIKKWTHQFKSSPCFIDTCFKENEEFVIFASQIAGETAVILNTWKSSEESPESCSTPFTPPGNLETLIALQSQGKCLNPHIKNRLLLCNTGCMATVDTQTSDIFLLTQNSINDIFYQGIGHPEALSLYSLENSKSLYKMKIWERQIIKTCHHDIISPLVVTKRTSAQNMFQNFTNQKLRPFDFNQEQTKVDYVPTWKRSIAELDLFKDIFAPELLKPWEIISETPSVPVAAAPHQKVLSWLETAQENNVETVTKDMLNSQESIFVTPQEPIYAVSDVLEQHDSESIQQLYLPKVKSQTKSHTKKHNKKINFVPGF